MRKSRIPTSVESTWMARALIRDAFAGGVLQETSRASWLSGGAAIHYDPVADTRSESRLELPEPQPDFEPIAGAVAVMAALVDRCNRQRCPTSSPLISPRQIGIPTWLHAFRLPRHLRVVRRIRQIA